MPHRLTSEQKSALKAFADRNGRSGKSRLCDLWMNGRDWREPEAPQKSGEQADPA